jgi:hypothetical protein
MQGTLLELINRLDELDDSDRFNPPTIYAEGGPNAAPAAKAVICAGDEEGKLVCPQDPALHEVLMVALAKEAVEVWSKWRGGRVPEPQDKFAAVMYYSRHDAYLPVEDNT